MNVSLYQAAAAMNASARWQEVIAGNLTASTVPGSRKQEISFSAIPAGTSAASGRPNASNFLMPTVTTATNFTQGTLRPTGLPTDLAIEGPGFLEVQLPNGSHAYSRDGELQLNAQGQLVTKQGYLVLGDGGPVQLDPGNASPVSVAANGQVSQNGAVKGRLRLVEFNQPGSLESIGGGCFVNKNPLMPPTPAQSSQVRQGFLEAPNMSPTTEMASLITAMRMFESNQKVMQLQDDRMGRVISDLGNPS